MNNEVSLDLPESRRLHNQRSNILLFGLYTLLAFFLSSVTSHEAAEAKEIAPTGWLIKGLSSSGRRQIEIDQKNVRIIFPDEEYECQASAPAWDIVWFNSNTHKQYSETFAHYRRRLALPVTPQALPNVTRIATTYAGLKSFRITIPETEYRQGALPQFELRQDSLSQKVRQVHYYFSDTADIPGGALELISAIYGTPNFGGVPLGCYKELHSGKLVKVFSTESVMRKQLSAKNFFRPHGYQNVQDVTFLSSGKSEKHIEEFLKDMKIGDDLYTKKK